MKYKSRIRRLAGVVLAVSLPCLTLPAFAQVRPAAATASQPRPNEPASDAADVCIGHHVLAQRERRQGRLLTASKELHSCLTPSCSPVLRGACATLLSEIERDTPSVVLAASSGTVELTEVSVYDGDVRIASALDGTPIQLDPGEHTLRFEAPGMTSTTQLVVLNTGERNRRVAVSLQPLAPAAPPPSQLARTPLVVAPPRPRSADAAARSSDVKPRLAAAPANRTWDYLLLGTGVTLLGLGFWRDQAALSYYDDTLKDCLGECTSEKDSFRNQRTVAIGLYALGGGVLGYGVFRLLFVGNDDHSASVSVGPLQISASGRF